MCRESEAPHAEHVQAAPKGVAQHFSQFFRGIGSSFRRMVVTQDMLVTSALLAVVWVAVALSYYGTILFGVHALLLGFQCVIGSCKSLVLS